MSYKGRKQGNYGSQPRKRNVNPNRFANHQHSQLKATKNMRGFSQKVPCSQTLEKKPLGKVEEHVDREVLIKEPTSPKPTETPKTTSPEPTAPKQTEEDQN